MPFLSNGNHRIHYQLDLATENKDADILILLHNHLSDLTIFDAIIPYLQSDYTLLRYDLRGFGMSEPLNEPANYTIYIEDLFFMIQQMNIKRIHLVGFGLSAMIALIFATLYPKLINNLILLSLPCNPPHTMGKIREHHEKITHSGMHLPVDYIIQTGPFLPTHHLLMEKWKMAVQNQNPYTYYQIINLLTHADPMNYLTKVEVPILILSGEKDLLFPQHYLSSLVKGFSQCLNLTIPGASDYMVLDKPGMTAMLIYDFIKDFSQPLLDSNHQASLLYEEIRTYALHWRKNEDATIRINLLDAFRVYINDHEITEGWNKRFAKPILIYLLFHQAATRDQICDSLWPDIPVTLAKKNLRVYLSYLKKLLHTAYNEADMLTTDREFIHLTGKVESDVMDLIHRLYYLIDIKDPEEKFALCQEMLNHLPLSFTLSLYDDWFLTLVDQITDKVCEQIIWMSTWLMEKGKKIHAVNHLKHYTSLFNNNEELEDKLDEILLST